MKSFLWALTDLKGCNLEKRNERVMLGLKNMRKQLPNYLNTVCFHEAGITSSCVECWHLDVPTNRTTGPPPRRLVEEVFALFRASSFGFSCPLVFRADRSSKPFFFFFFFFFFFYFLYIFLTSLLEYNCFKMVCFCFITK